MSYSSLAAGFLPVLLFLAGLLLMDSYKLVPMRTLAASLAAGVGAAGLALLTNDALVNASVVSWDTLVHFVAPTVEETFKALFVIWLISGERVGFTVDAAICGFAIGTGFGLIENVHHARVYGDMGLGMWLGRGLGPAIM